MYTKSDSAIQLGSSYCFLVDFLWMRCEQDLEQADVDPGEIEVVEADVDTILDWLQLNLSVSKFLSNVMRYKKRKAFSPPQGCLLELHCSNGELNTCPLFKYSGLKKRPIPQSEISLSLSFHPLKLQC